ncbi:CPBP family intramembrane glutamic endopeptidase [Flavivirga abyssicola]|uniref:CPBP family intramembrane glutamic endopeptidase n=1 Tax=Flavivirga abyssicola TaxID=3063533 RepID=UPI0026E0D98A|nr:CPBP family intramembrane glutamic endopeptidase [Flavivirga sp. MEBiC07777]WVK14095.1 CPBP family intramembrane glutamic endopeptidase [Flavivirga sp. MEBiC07777]
MRPNLTKDLIAFSETKLKRPISNKTRVFEILGVVITALGKFVFMDYLNWRLPFVVIAMISWFLYIFFRYKIEKGVIKYWGFRTDNFKKALKLMIPFSMVSLMLIFGIGYFQNTIKLTWHILPLLITYPIWGSVQQFLIIGLVAGNLNDLNSKKLSKSLIIVITSVLFSIVHFPSMWLMIGTFILALFYGYVYLKVKNIYVMGIFHGWLGALFYYIVVNQDPFQDVFLIFLN